MLNPAISGARRLFAAGDHDGALTVLRSEIYDNGLTVDLQEELNRLFPITDDAKKKLKDYEQRFGDADAKIRHTAAKEISRKALGELSNLTWEFFRLPETTAFFIKHLGNSDPVIQEQMTITLGMAFCRYTSDDRAFEPLVGQLTSKSINTRAWAIQALAHLTDRAVDPLLPMIYDKAERVRTEAFGNLGFMLRGGGTLSRPAMKSEWREKIRAAFLEPDLDRDADFRIGSAFLLAETAHPEDLPVLQNWMKKDRSKEVKKVLHAGIDRLVNPPADLKREASRQSCFTDESQAQLHRGPIPECHSRAAWRISGP